MKTYILSVEGMMCGHCTARVEKALRAVEGVADVEVSLEEKAQPCAPRTALTRASSRPPSRHRIIP